MDRIFEFDKNSFSRYLGRGVCLLIELSHSLFSQRFCFTNNTKTLEIDGITYEPYPFDIILPAQTEMQGTQLTMSNIKNLVANEIEKTINSNENIVLNLYIANVEDEVAERYYKGEYEIFTPSITPEAVTANINLRHSFDINCSSMRYTKELFPNLFLT